MAEVSHDGIRPLVPRLLLKEESGCEEISGEISNRFNLPAARLVWLPPGFLKSICSQLIGNPEDNLEDYLEEDKITYTAISSVIYDTNDGHKIYLTTLLLSRKASMLEYRVFESIIASDGSQPVKRIVLRDNTEAMSFFNPTREDTKNQIVFLKERQYYITVGSNLPMDSLIELVSNHLVIE